MDSHKGQAPKHYVQYIILGNQNKHRKKKINIPSAIGNFVVSNTCKYSWQMLLFSEQIGQLKVFGAGELESSLFISLFSSLSHFTDTTQHEYKWIVSLFLLSPALHNAPQVLSIGFPSGNEWEEI